MAERAAAAPAAVLGLDDDVAALAAVAVAPLDDRAADDDSAADAGAQGEHHQAVRVSACAGPVFAVGGGVAVVLKDDRLVEPIGEQLCGSAGCPSREGWAGSSSMPASRSIVPGEPSPTAAMRSQSSPLASTALFPAATRLSSPSAGPVVGLGRHADRRERPTVVVDHAALDVRAAQVDAEEKRAEKSWPASIKLHLATWHPKGDRRICAVRNQSTNSAVHAVNRGGPCDSGDSNDLHGSVIQSGGDAAPGVTAMRIDVNILRNVPSAAWAGRRRATCGCFFTRPNGGTTRCAAY